MTPTKEIYRPELRHRCPGVSRDEFLSEVDATGGWPVGCLYVRFFHDDQRQCLFTDDPINRCPEYWTTVCSADDYYWWKLSDKRKEKERAEMLKKPIMDILFLLDRP